MNKSILTLLAAGLVLTGCSNENPVNIAGDGEEVQVSFTANLPSTINSRTYSDGQSATELTWAIYDAGTTTPLLTGTETFVNLKATVSTTLVSGKTYDFVFWAQNTNAPYTFTPSTQEMVINYSSENFTANNENLDAFFKTEKSYKVTGAVNETFMLSRPFAQVNIGTTDWTEASAAGIDATQSTVTIPSYTTLNLYTGEVSEEATAEFKLNALPGADETFRVPNCKYLAMAYVLMPDSKQTVDVTYNLSPDASTPYTFGGVPVQRNYRTNIYGALLTNPANFIVEINPDYAGEDLPYEVTAKTPEDLANALNSPAISEITIPDNTQLDMSEMTQAQLTSNSPKTITLGEGSEIVLPSEGHMVANDDLTIIGTPSTSAASRADGEVTIAGGVLTNVYEGATDPADTNKNLIVMNTGTLTIKNMTLINDPSYHYHGSRLNTAAISYYNDANIVVEDSRIYSGEFTICGMGRGVACGEVTLTNSYFESTSSSANGTNFWAYAMRIYGTTSTLTNCEVKGIQGAVSSDSMGLKMTINGGKYYTVNSPGKTDAFYAVYVTNGSELTILDGEFSSPNVRSKLAEGKASVVCGDNDVALPLGSVIIKGGKFSGKAYNHVTNEVYNPEAPLEYVPLTDDAPYIWGVGTASSN